MYAHTPGLGKVIEGLQLKVPWLGQQDGSLDKDICCQAWKLELGPWILETDPAGGENQLP